MDLALPEVTRLARITIFVALRNEFQLEQELRSENSVSLTPALIREAILQSYLFAGYAAAINAFIVCNRVFPGNTEFLQEKTGTLARWKRRGLELCRRIYGGQYENLVRNMNALHPDLADWMISEGYGKVLSRPFLSPRVRELLIVSTTAVLAVERQFISHVRGACNVGATAEEVRHIYEEAAAFLDPATAARFRAIVAEHTRQ